MSEFRRQFKKAEMIVMAGGLIYLTDQGFLVLDTASGTLSRLGNTYTTNVQQFGMQEWTARYNDNVYFFDDDAGGGLDAGSAISVSTLSLSSEEINALINFESAVGPKLRASFDTLSMDVVGDYLVAAYDYGRAYFSIVDLSDNQQRSPQIYSAGSGSWEVGVSLRGISSTQFVVGWDDRVADIAPNGYYIAIWNIYGDRQIAPISLDSTWGGYTQCVQFLDLGDNKFAAVYQNAGLNMYQSKIFMKIFDDQLNQIGERLQISPTSNEPDVNPAFAALPDGKILVAWHRGVDGATSPNGNLYGSQVFARVIDVTNGSMSGEFLVGDGEFADVKITGSKAVISYLNDGVLHADFFDASLVSGYTFEKLNVTAASIVDYGLIGRFSVEQIGCGDCVFAIDDGLVAGLTTVGSSLSLGQGIVSSGILSFDMSKVNVISIEWFSGELAIEGATLDAYRIVSSDLGKFISVKVLAEDQDGHTITLLGTCAGASSASHVGTFLVDQLNGSGGNDQMLGLGGNDKLSGLAGNDYLDGGAGNDSMYGGLGDDVYVVDSSRDLVSEKKNEGTDEVLTGLASYTLGVNVENLTYSGTGNFTGKGTSAANVLTGGVGNDSLDGLTGADTLVGGAGSDTYTIDNAGDVVTELAGAGTDTVLSSVAVTALAANVENLSLAGTASINATGNGLDNRLTGNGGANVLDGGVGADTLTGGSGNDTYVIDAGDTVVELSNGGTDTVRASFNYVLGANVENLVLVGAEAVNGTGNTLANTLTGNTVNNALDGGAGNDTLDGGGGVDTLTGSAGNDTFVTDGDDVIVEAAGGGTDTVQTSVAYTLAASVENLTLTGTGAVNGTGNSGNNALTGNSAANTLDGGTGTDTLIGGLGNDTYVTDGGDTITEASNGGTDLVQSSANHTLASNVENLTLTGTASLSGTGNTLNNLLTGNSGANLLDGGTGNDSLTGGDGADSLVGGVGTDQLIGGSGADVFVFKTATESSNVLATADFITDFVQGQDRIDLTAIDASLSLTGNNAFVWLGTSAIGTATSGDLRYQKYDNSGTANDYTLVIADTDNDSASEFMIKLVGLYDLTANDFLL